MDGYLLVMGVMGAGLIAAAGGFFWLLSRQGRVMPARPRQCPICGKELAIGENLLAERTGLKKENKEHIIIKGCPYCLGRKFEIFK